MRIKETVEIEEERRQTGGYGIIPYPERRGPRRQDQLVELLPHGGGDTAEGHESHIAIDEPDLRQMGDEGEKVQCRVEPAKKAEQQEGTDETSHPLPDDHAPESVTGQEPDTGRDVLEQTGDGLDDQCPPHLLGGPGQGRQNLVPPPHGNQRHIDGEDQGNLRLNDRGGMKQREECLPGQPGDGDGHQGDDTDVHHTGPHSPLQGHEIPPTVGVGHPPEKGAAHDTLHEVKDSRQGDDGLPHPIPGDSHAADHERDQKEGRSHGEYTASQADGTLFEKPRRNGAEFPPAFRYPVGHRDVPSEAPVVPRMAEMNRS